MNAVESTARIASLVLRRSPHYWWWRWAWRRSSSCFYPHPWARATRFQMFPNPECKSNRKSKSVFPVRLNCACGNRRGGTPVAAWWRGFSQESSGVARSTVFPSAWRSAGSGKTQKIRCRRSCWSRRRRKSKFAPAPELSQRWLDA